MPHVQFFQSGPNRAVITACSPLIRQQEWNDRMMWGGGSWMDSSERKKQTHLRCERQRREAINTGYSDLKALLPASTSFAGCKTTNASILFRAADYVKSLDETIKQKEKTMKGFESSQAAMRMIIQQYESMGADKPQPIHTQILKTFLDRCFESFAAEVDMNDYSAMTKSMLLWVEQLDYQDIVQSMTNELDLAPAR